MACLPRQALDNFFGPEVADAEEETFLLFSQAIPSRDLGMVDPSAQSLELQVAGRDIIVQQSPTVLKSTREGGTTGAAVWCITPIFADWISAPDNIFRQHGALTSDSAVLELGCGISGIVPTAMSPAVGQFIATDQDYVFKLLRANIAANAICNADKARAARKGSKKRSTIDRQVDVFSSNIETVALDWEQHSVEHISNLVKGGQSDSAEAQPGLDVVLACDCVFNEALVEPFVETCKALSDLRPPEESRRPTLCIVAQQLRSPDVFGCWISSFMERFCTWRLPDQHLSPDLREGSGFVVHVGILRSGS